MHELAGEAVLLHRGFRREQSAERTEPQRRMRIGVACGVFVDAVARLLKRRRILAVAGHGVVFRIRREHRLAFAERCAEGGRHGRRALFHLEALLAQQLHIPGGGSIFPPRRLVKAPDFRMQFRQPVRLRLDPVQGGLFGRRQRGRTPIAGRGRMVMRHQGLRRTWRKRARARTPAAPASVGSDQPTMKALQRFTISSMLSAHHWVLKLTSLLLMSGAVGRSFSLSGDK